MRTPVFGVRVVYATRAVYEPLRQQIIDSTASLCTVFKTVRNDAVESIICRRGGSQTARVTRTARAPVFGVRG
eukprot:2260045-Lingulodinium_polyedra.AAC.1